MTQEEWEEIGKVVEGINLVGDDPAFIPYWEWRVQGLEKKHGKEVLLAAMKECHLRLKKLEETKKQMFPKSPATFRGPGDDPY